MCGLFPPVAMYSSYRQHGQPSCMYFHQLTKSNKQAEQLLMALSLHQVIKLCPLKLIILLASLLYLIQLSIQIRQLSNGAEESAASNIAIAIRKPHSYCTCNQCKYLTSRKPTFRLNLISCQLQLSILYTYSYGIQLQLYVCTHACVYVRAAIAKYFNIHKHKRNNL